MEYFVYRLNFFLWRFRNVVFLLSLIFFWQAVYQQRGEIFGYHQNQMLTYVVGMAVLRAIIFGTRTADLAGMIKSGELVGRFLLRPWNVTQAFFFRDLAPKLLDITFGLAELFLLIKIFHLPLFISSSYLNLLSFFLAMVVSFLLYFFLSLSFSLIAFWVDNVWAPRWLFGVIFLEFMSGVFFPLDVLPSGLVKIINLTPFPYLLYFPLKIYLGQVDFSEARRILLIMLAWLIIIVLLVKELWRRGLKVYSSYGG